MAKPNPIVKSPGFILAAMLVGFVPAGSAAVIPYSAESARALPGADPSRNEPSGRSVLRYDLVAQQTKIPDPAGAESVIRTSEPVAPMDPPTSSLDDRVSFLPVSATKIPEPATLLAGILCIAIAGRDWLRTRRRTVERS